SYTQSRTRKGRPPMWSTPKAATAAALVLAATTVHAATPAQSCQSGKNRTAGKYASCRQRAEAKYATTGNATARTTALQKCLDKYNAKWPDLEQKAVDAGGACPSVGDAAAIQSVIADDTDSIAVGLAGGGFVATCHADLAACLMACPAAGAQPLRTG